MMQTNPRKHLYQFNQITWSSKNNLNQGGIEKVKTLLNRHNLVSSQKLARHWGISRSNVQRILKNDLKFQTYKMPNEPMLTCEHKAKRLKFANWVRTNFRKEDTMKILFSDEKLFDIDEIYNSQNDRICAEADIKGGIRQIGKFLQKVVVWFGTCSTGLSPLVIFENGTVDHSRYINEVLPVALKYGNGIFRNSWTFQQDGAKLHFHEKTQKWCINNFPSFIE